MNSVLMINIGLLIIRLVVGLSYAGHGSMKLFGWFDGGGLDGTAKFFESVGIKPGKLMAFAAGASELLSGLLFAAGVFMPIAAILIIFTMLVAIITVTGKNGYWITKNGWEFGAILMAVTLGVTLIGPGKYILF